MALTPREQIASATMIATHEVVSNLTRAKHAIENLIHEMADVTALVTTDGRVIWGNRATAEWLQTDHDVLHEASIRPLFDDENWRLFGSQLASVAAGKNPFAEFTTLISLQNARRVILWNLKPFRAVSDRRGNLTLITGHDITDVLEARTERAKLEAELETAQILQQRFLPPPVVQTKYLALASFYRPAEQCSGDWWGYFDLGGGRELVCVADVTGHGAASALVTSMTQALTLSFVQRNQGQAVTPAALIREINEIVYQTFQGDMYMTFFAFVVDVKRGLITGSNAAHNFPMRLKPLSDGTLHLEAIVVSGNPIGHELVADFKDLELPASQGDKFILYTDGITEGRNPSNKMYGSGAFRRSILRHMNRPANALRDKLVEDAVQFYNGQPLGDDITLVVFEII